MKIKRKDYEKLQAQLAHYQKIGRTRVVIESQAGKLLDTDMQSWAISARYAPENYEWISGVIKLVVIPENYASGYETFLVNKYLAPDDGPWNIIQNIHLTPEPPGDKL